MKFAVTTVALGITSMTPFTYAWTANYYDTNSNTACGGTPIKTISGSSYQCVEPPSGAAYFIPTFDAAGHADQYTNSTCLEPDYGAGSQGLVSGNCAYVFTESYLGIQD